MSNRDIRTVIANQTLVTLPTDTSIRHAAIVMSEHNIGAVPVVDDGRLVGIFTERDILRRVVARDLDINGTTLGQVMTPNPQTTAANRPVSHALHLMHEAGYRHMPVVEDGRLIGMISARDAHAREQLTFEQAADFRESVVENLR